MAQQKHTFRMYLPLSAIIVIVIAVGSLAAIGIAQMRKHQTKPVLTRQLVDQYFRGLETCDFRAYITAKRQAVYKDLAWDTSYAKGQEKEQFDGACGKVSNSTYLRSKIDTRAEDTITTYYYRVRLQEVGQAARTVIVAPSVVGNSADGYTIIDSPRLLTEAQYQRMPK